MSFYCEDGTGYKPEFTSILNTWIISSILNTHTHKHQYSRERRERSLRLFYKASRASLNSSMLYPLQLS